MHFLYVSSASPPQRSSQASRGKFVSRQEEKLEKEGEESKSLPLVSSLPLAELVTLGGFDTELSPPTCSVLPRGPESSHPEQGSQLRMGSLLPAK